MSVTLSRCAAEGGELIGDMGGEVLVLRVPLRLLEFLELSFP